MSEKGKKLLLIFSICLNIGFLAFTGIGYYKYQTGEPRSYRMKKFSSSVIFETVDLNDRQKEEIERLGELYQANKLAIRKETSPLKVRTMQLLAKPMPLDEAAAARYKNEIRALDKKRGEIIQEHFLSLRKVLTDEQAEKVFTKFADIQQKWADRIRFPDKKR